MKNVALPLSGTAQEYHNWVNFPPLFSKTSNLSKIGCIPSHHPFFFLYYFLRGVAHWRQHNISFSYLIETVSYYSTAFFFQIFYIYPVFISWFFWFSFLSTYFQPLFKNLMSITSNKKKIIKWSEIWNKNILQICSGRQIHK